MLKARGLYGVLVIGCALSQSACVTPVAEENCYLSEQSNESLTYRCKSRSFDTALESLKLVMKKQCGDNYIIEKLIPDVSLQPVSVPVAGMSSTMYKKRVYLDAVVSCNK